ncbi:MAG: ATP-binding protein, partial [Solirubrobacteraceae bacterium]
MTSAVFPFTAIVGQEALGEALLACAVDPRIGGVLVRGERGTAKSTAVRALAPLLGDVEVVAGCRFNADPVLDAAACPDGPHDGAEVGRRPVALVELPVGATADRLLGSLDLDRALRDGVAAFEPGLLAAAHRGILYADEVNLLPDHLVDVLLDAAAMGRAHVEREAISVSHPARFLL